MGVGEEDGEKAFRNRKGAVVFMPENFEKVFDRIQKLFMGKASELYSDKALTLAFDPLNVGEIENPDGFAKVKGECGDSMQVQLKLAGGNICEARFLTDGCGATLACGSAVTELTKGRTPWDARKIYPQTVVRYLDGLPASHMHCAVLAVQALREALKFLKNADTMNESDME
jgi:nitrogen fixation NifU-like protein